MYRQFFLKLLRSSEWTHYECDWSLGDCDTRGKLYERIEQIHFWYKDISEVIQELFENPDLQEDMITHQ